VFTPSRIRSDADAKTSIDLKRGISFGYGVPSHALRKLSVVASALKHGLSPECNPFERGVFVAVLNDVEAVG
jgi:hypothetical protein